MKAYIHFDYGDPYDLPIYRVECPIRNRDWPNAGDYELFFEGRWRVVRDNGKDYSVMYNNMLRRVTIT